MRLHQFRTARVNLATQQPAALFEHRHLQAEQVQRVGGLQAEQPAARNDGSTAVVPLGVRADLHRVTRLAQRETAGPVQATDRGHGCAGAHRQDQAVEGQRVADAELHASPTQIDPGGHRVEPRVHTVVVVPLLGQQVEALHCGAAVHQPRDAHPVVQGVR